MGHYLTFGTANSSTFNIYISGEGVFNAPNRDVELVSVPGKNGQLIIDHNRFENIQVTYPAFNYESTISSFSNDLSNLRNAFSAQKGYQKLTDTFHTDEFRLATFVDGFEADPVMYNTAARFDLVFNCKPQRFLTSGETKTTLTSGNAINNPTLFPSKPLFEVVGSGTLTVGTIAIAISESGTKYIDCDTMECYAISGGVPVSKNDKIALTEFPELAPGNTTISWTGLTSVKCTPRWWKL